MGVTFNASTIAAESYGVNAKRQHTAFHAVARRWLAASGFVALVLTCAVCLAQAPQTADPRVVIDRLDANFREFNAIGVVYPIAKTDGVVITARYRGTGAMISACHMLTNYHVAFEASRREVLFEVGQTAGDVAGFAYKTVGQIIDAGAFWAERDIVDDWALVKLIDPRSRRSSNVGDRVGFLQIAAAPPATILERPVTSAGYPGGQALGLIGHVNCRLARVDQDRRWRMACSMTEGQSGGPVTLRTADRGDVLIALNAAKPEGRSGIVTADEARLSNLNYAMPLTRAAESRIRRSMAASRCD